MLNKQWNYFFRCQKLDVFETRRDTIVYLLLYRIEVPSTADSTSLKQINGPVRAVTFRAIYSN